VAGAVTDGGELRAALTAALFRFDSVGIDADDYRIAVEPLVDVVTAYAAAKLHTTAEDMRELVPGYVVDLLHGIATAEEARARRG